MTQAKPSLFNRLFLPGLAFKAVVIGGGYATGRELVSFFLPSGPRGGLYAIALATVVWSIVCAVTFVFAFRTKSRDYRTFFGHLLGPLWPLFEIGYVFALMVILAVYAAAAGAIGQALFGWPPLVGSMGLVAAIAAVAMWGNEAVEQLFKYVSFVLYGTYALLLAVALLRFGDRSLAALAAPVPPSGWFAGGLTYAGYNIIGAVVILPVTRHMARPRDAVLAGLLAGPLAMAPAAAFFLCLVAFYPGITEQVLPSDFLLSRIGIPPLRIGFELMIFSALLESGTGGVHAINERVARAYARSGRALAILPRLAITLGVLTTSVFVATRVGLVDLVASGYRWLAYLFLAIYVAPALSLGVWRLCRREAVLPVA